MLSDELVSPTLLTLRRTTLCAWHRKSKSYRQTSSLAVEEKRNDDDIPWAGKGR